MSEAGKPANFIPGLNVGGQVVVPGSGAPAAGPTAEQRAAADKAEMDSYIGESRDFDPDAHGDSKLTPEQRKQVEQKPKKLDAKAVNIDEDNERATPAVLDEEGDEDEADEDEADENGADEDEADEDEADDDSQEDKDEKPKRPKKSVSERIRELTRSRGEADRAKDALAQENADLKRRLEALERGEKPPAKTKSDGDGGKSDEGKPDPTKFKFGEIDPEYIAAVVNYETDKRMKAADEKREKDAAEAQRAVRLAELETKRDAMAEAGVAEFGDSYFDIVIKGAVENKWPISPVMAELTFESEVGYKIAHHLATHPKEAREVYGKSPVAQAAYFGRLEAQFLSGKKPAAKSPKTLEPPKVPNPPKHAARGAGGKFTVTADTDDFAAFEAMAARQQRRG